tara:strand:- start:896 stop:1177 length:282 start_codon:yes stop_codon:yes gene_type:complete
MNKDELIKELERLKAEYKNYSNNTSMNTGYRTAILDAIDLVKKLTIPNVSNCDSDTKDLIEHTKRVLDLIKSKSGMAVKVLSNRVNNKLEQLN